MIICSEINTYATFTLPKSQKYFTACKCKDKLKLQTNLFLIYCEKCVRQDIKYIFIKRLIYFKNINDALKKL